MGRPVHANAEVTRGRILKTALRLFSEQGSSASIRDIALAAGITLATVHHYFGTKEQLYAACIDAMYLELEALRSELEPTVAQGGTAPEIIERATRTAFRFAWAHRGALRLLMRDVIDKGQLEPVRRNAVHIPFLERGGRILAFLLARPEHETRLLIQTLMHLIVRYALSSEDELSMLTGAPSERALELVESHVAGLALALVTPKEHP